MIAASVPVWATIVLAAIAATAGIAGAALGPHLTEQATLRRERRATYEEVLAFLTGVAEECQTQSTFTDWRPTDRDWSNLELRRLSARLTLVGPASVDASVERATKLIGQFQNAQFRLTLGLRRPDADTSSLDEMGAYEARDIGVRIQLGEIADDLSASIKDVKKTMRDAT